MQFLPTNKYYYLRSGVEIYQWKKIKKFQKLKVAIMLQKRFHLLRAF